MKRKLTSTDILEINFQDWPLEELIDALNEYSDNQSAKKLQDWLKSLVKCRNAGQVGIKMEYGKDKLGELVTAGDWVYWTPPHLYQATGRIARVVQCCDDGLLEIDVIGHGRIEARPNDIVKKNK